MSTMDNSNKQRLQFVGIAGGILVSYMTFGVLQEKVTKGDYNGEKFDFFFMLVAVQCGLFAAVAKSITIFFLLLFTMNLKH